MEILNRKNNVKKKDENRKIGQKPQCRKQKLDQHGPFLKTGCDSEGKGVPVPLVTNKTKEEQNTLTLII